MNFMIRGISVAVAVTIAGPLMAAGPLVTALELNEMLTEGKVVLLDIRGGAVGAPEAYAEGHIPGAISTPLGGAPWRGTVDGVPIQRAPIEGLEAHVRGLGINSDTPVVIYTQGAANNLGDFAGATRAYWTLKSIGHDRVSILNGGLEGWKAEGLPVALSATVASQEGNFRASLNPAIEATLADVEVAYASGAATLLDARPFAQYTGDAQASVVKAAGTIPGAVNATAVHFMDGNMIVDRAAVQAKMALIGLTPNDPIITFCNGGYFCTAMWFVAHEVGGFGNVKVFDGSMAEWTLDPARDVAPGSWASLHTVLTN